MTIDEVKEELPDVKVCYDNTIQWANVYGRKNDFASVYPVNAPDGVKFEVSWLAVANAAGNDQAYINLD
jgi:hypothetical protein